MAGERNHEMNLAWQLIASTNTSVFLTGKAGTGKTTFLRRLRELSPKRMVVLAPTGVAAINAGGQTIHSFFQLPFGPIVPGMEREARKSFRMSEEKKRLIRTLDLLVIDEISMVRCDLLDAIDAELRKYRWRGKPFGGVQLLLIGDLQQLAPVAKESEWQLLASHYSTPYFFGSKALQQTPYVTVELRHVYRQQDEAFVNLLGKIRNNRVDNETVQKLNARYVAGFVPPADEDWIRLTTHNYMADNYNGQMLTELEGRPWHFHAEVKGNFPETSFPAEEDLVLKPGAQVMFIKNDPSGAHEYYNGKIGIVRSFDEEGITVFSKEDGLFTVVPQVEWENTKFAIDEETKEIKEEVEGTFRQYPLRLAWAITVHKSQGLTFDHAVLDINDAFAHGQTYVALSRCRTLEGLVLSRPLSTAAVITDASVNEYINRELDEARHVEDQLPQMKREYFLALLGEAFSFDTLYSDLRYVHRIASEHFYKTYPDYVQLLSDALPQVERDLQQVAAKFSLQYSCMEEGTQLQERIHAAVGYFGKKTHEIFDVVLGHSALTITNKQVEKQYTHALDALKLSYKIKTSIFATLATEEFTVQNYLTAKAHAVLTDAEKERLAQKKAAKPKNSKAKQEPSDQPEDPALFEALRLLRTEIAKEKKVPPYVIFPDKTLHELAAERPLTPEALLQVYGVGAGKAELYGDRFLEVIRECEAE